MREQPTNVIPVDYDYDYDYDYAAADDDGPFYRQGSSRVGHRQGRERESDEMWVREREGACV